MLAAAETFDKIPEAYRNDFIDRKLSIQRQYLASAPGRYWYLIIMVKPVKETITARAAKSVPVKRSSLRVVLGPRA